jgi:hypothetical protein
LIDPPSHVQRAVLKLDAIVLAAAEKSNGILVYQRHVFQIQNQLLLQFLGSDRSSQLLDILNCLDPAAEY